MSLSYRSSGVDYGTLDRFKRTAQYAMGATAKNIFRLPGYQSVEESRGETAHLTERPNDYIAHVIESLGTKNIVADEMQRLTGKSYYDQIAYDAVAMIVNDIIPCGALPISLGMLLSVGESKWFVDETRYTDLINGWVRGATAAGCVAGPGETPALKDVISKKRIVLAGSAVGIIEPKGLLIDSKNIEDGDHIVFIGSSGIHANGISLAREIASWNNGFLSGFQMLYWPSVWTPPAIFEGYLTKLSDGRTFGESLLDPTIIYVPLIEACQKAGVRIKYAVNITGHGWRKLMRAREPFIYIIEEVGTPHPVFTFMQEWGPLTDREAYSTLNMGAGFALYVAQNDVDMVITLAQSCGMQAWWAGHIHEWKGQKKVMIKPKNIIFEAEELQVR